MAEEYKVGAVIGLRAGFSKPVSEFGFKVTSPDGDVREHNFGQTKLITRQSDSAGERYSMALQLQRPGNWVYETHAVLDGLPVNKRSTFMVTGEPVHEMTLSEGMVMAVDPVNEKGDADFANPGEPDSDDDADDLSEADLAVYAEGLAESIPADAPESDFAAPPKGLYVGDAKHARLAVQAVSGGLMGNRAGKDKREAPGAKSKIAAAIRKFYKGDQQKYYLSWLHTGKKPDKGKPAAEMKRMAEISMPIPFFRAEDQSRFPSVPTAAGVDFDRLKGSDPAPLIVTRPLAVEGGVSDNGRKYTAEMLDQIYQQVLAKRPPARLGHVSEANRSWEVPPDSGLWIGALDSPDDKIFGSRTVYGKCYIYPTMPLHEMIDKRDAAGTPLSNSIWGMSDDVENDDGTVSSSQLELESIDFVSPERAALKALGGDFKVTSEMQEESMGAKEDTGAQPGAMFSEIAATLKPEAIHDMLHELGSAHGVAEAHMRAHETGKCGESSIHEMFSKETRGKVAEAHMREASPEETYKMLSEAQRAHCAEAYAKETGNTLKPVQEETKTKESMSEMTTRVTEMQARISELEKV